MKKKITSLIIIVFVLVSFFSSLNVYARSLTASEMRTKITALKSKYPTGWKWEDGWCIDYHTGNCGPGYKGVAWECMGFAYKLCTELFEEESRNFYEHTNVDNLCVGDYVRRNGHSFVVTNIIGNTVYYVDCNGLNGYGYNVVCWNRSMTKSQLKNGLSHIKTQKDNWIKTLDEEKITAIHKDNNPHVRNGFFTFKNIASGKYMQVNGGQNIDKQPIDMWSFDGSIDQRFNVIHKGSGKYMLYPECSKDGHDKVVDIFRNGAAIAEGQLVDLYTQNDNEAQMFYIWPVGNDEYVFEIASKNGYVICPKDSSAAGKDGYKNGSQLVVQKYTGASHQKWKLCNNNGKDTTPNISYTAGSYKIDTDGDPLNVRSGAGTANSLIGNIPDKTTLRVTQVNGNWGYTSYNGTNGWVCLDFTVYTVTLDSISVSIYPDKTSYFIGDDFDSTGMQITATYSNGQTEHLASGFTTSANFTSEGTNIVTVAYKGKTTTIPIEVQKPEISRISFNASAKKLRFNVGEKIDTTGLELLVGYSNGDTSIITSGFTTDYDFSTPGTKTVTVSYGGKSTSYDVEVLENTSSDTPKIEISSEKCYSGSSAIVDVKLKSKDVYDGNMTIEYDADNLKLVSVEACGALSDRQVTINPEYSENQIRISFSGTTPVISNDTILKIKFTAFNNAEGTANIKVFETKIYDKTGNPITTYASDGKIDITNVVYGASVTNIQSVSSNGRKIVTADVSSDKVVCYLVSYRDGQLVECDKKYPVNGSVELSIANDDNAQFKFMVWNEAMKPMIEAKNIY